MQSYSFLPLIVVVGICELAGIIGSIFTTSSVSGWYVMLIKPALNLPNEVFGIVWTILYALMGIAAFLVWKKGFQQHRVKLALSIFGLQLFLNTLWSIIFFGLQSPAWALVDIMLLWFTIIWTMIVFYKISKWSVWFLVPYILWVSFAVYLNYSIWILNY